MIYDNNASIYSFLLPPSPVNYQTPLDIIGNKIEVNKWTFVVMTFDGLVLRVYLNGVLTNSRNAPVGFQLNTLGVSGMSIGVTRQANGFWQPYDGDIDDVRIYNRAITQSEINYLATH